MKEIDDEIKQYLRSLLDHCRECHDPTCVSHTLLNDVCTLIRERIFAGVIQKEVPVASQEGREMGGAGGKA